MKKTLSTQAKEPIRLRSKKLAQRNLPMEIFFFIWISTVMAKESMSFLSYISYQKRPKQTRLRTRKH